MRDHVEVLSILEGITMFEDCLKLNIRRDPSNDIKKLIRSVRDQEHRKGGARLSLPEL